MQDISINNSLNSNNKYGNQKNRMVHANTPYFWHCLCYLHFNVFNKHVSLAPVKSVNITLDPDTLTCDTKGVYPDPTLVWSTEPPSDVQQVGPPVEEKNGQDLYSVTSTVHKISNTTYICTVTAGDSTQSVSLRQQSKWPFYLFQHTSGLESGM